MESRRITVNSKKDTRIQIDIIPGHFATNHSHINYYVDMTSLKTSSNMAKLAAGELAALFRTTYIDTIICLEGTQIIGAHIAEALSQSGYSNVNEGNDIYVITPEFNSNSQMIFRDNTQRMIKGKKILLLMASASTGKSINTCIECLAYYGGELTAIASIFSAVKQTNETPVKSVFTAEDIPEYFTASPADCILCRNGTRVDAIVNSYGYSKI